MTDLIDKKAFAEYKRASLAGWNIRAKEDAARKQMENHLKPAARALRTIARRACYELDEWYIHCIEAHGWISIDHRTWKAEPMVTLRAEVWGTRLEWHIDVRETDAAKKLAMAFGNAWASMLKLKKLILRENA